MSLTSSLYSGTSGLTNTGSALQVTSNNISNINTIGFKKGTSTFADTLYQSIGTNAGSSQVGLGMNIDSVSQVFTDGSLETTSNSTDLAISGDGFFVVSEQGSDQTYYTRAGNFSFDESGALATSSGYVLQGWYVDANSGEEYGGVTDLVLTDYTCPPDDTEEVTLIVNLDSDSDSLVNVLSNYFEYDEESGTTVDADAYEYQTVITVYDSLGSAHEATVYFDKVSDTEWEYVITCDPDEDNRSTVEALDSAGLLARGSITFSESSGEIVSMTMEEYTGQIGDVQISGNNSVDTVNFEIQDTEALALDGYGLSMTFDGEEWVLSSSSTSTSSSWLDAYPDAEIIYSDENTVHLVLDPTSSGGTEEPDIIITLDENAQDGDTLSFDVNDALDCNVQDVEIKEYSGSTSANTSMAINDASVMTVDAENLEIVWNPSTETWAWSNPEKAADDETLITGMALTTTGTAGTTTLDATNIDITDAEAMALVAEEIDLYWNGTDWDWNEDLKDADLTITASDVDCDSDPTISVETYGSDGAATVAGDYTLTWSGTGWTATTTSTGSTVAVTATTDKTVELTIYSSGTAGASTIEISLDDEMTTSGGQTIDFTIDSTPPAEYADAQVLASSSGNGDIVIDFDGDSSGDLTINVTAGTGNALVASDTFTFDVDPDTAPEEYADAVLTGDETYVSIDLDGSGDDGGEDQDIIFTFTEDLTTGTDIDSSDPDSISFNIEGSTAWREVTTEEAEETGYLQFTVDFLGGDAGSTETDISFNIGTSWDGNNWINDSLSSTQYATSSSTTYQDADGYASGDLEGVEVDSNGLVTGTYSNGQTLALFLVALADFNNCNGLDNVGDNLYSETSESGAAITNKAGENGLGDISSYTLESSNVDISEEFVDMIELQNAYEANAKIISTVDEMLSTVISMKR